MEVPQKIVLKPPQTLQTECPPPLFNGATVGDLFDYTTILIDLLKICNEHIKAQKDWYDANGITE